MDRYGVSEDRVGLGVDLHLPGGGLFLTPEFPDFITPGLFA